MNRQKITIIALSLTLFVLVQYLVTEKLLEDNRNKMLEIYQNGYDQGLKDAVTTIFQQTTDCKTSTISIGNLSKQILDMICLENGSAKLSP